jgi:multifunctional beta-oxidation protein
MWKEGNKVIFVTKVVERNVIAISNAAVELRVAGGGKSDSSAKSGSTSLEVAGFGASKVFTAIQKGLTTLPSDEKTKLVKKTNAVFAFAITSADKKTQSWFVDMKNGEGSVGIGATKADMTVSVADKDFLDLAAGSLQPQKAFMSGKIKIKGNMGLSNKLEAVLKLAAPKGKL